MFPVRGGELLGELVCSRVGVDLQVHPRSILQTQKRHFYCHYLLQLGTGSFPCSPLFKEELLSLHRPFCWSPRSICGLQSVFSGCDHSEPGMVSLFWRVRMLLLPAYWPTEAPHSSEASSRFGTQDFLSKPKSLGESTVCHYSLPDQWCPQSEWLFQQKLAGSWHP